jgi:Tol biopolymer transport system component
MSLTLALALAAVAHTDPAAALGREVHGRGWIAFGARTPAGDWDLFVMRPDGSDRRNITSTPAFNEGLPRFSPDGTRLLYRRVPRDELFDNNRHGLQGELVLATATGGNPRALGAAGEYPWASWGPDGKQIACLGRRDVAFVDVTTGQVARTLPRHGLYQQLVWSPDGRRLAGVANDLGTSWSVASVDAATGAVTAVSRNDCCTPDWFPDGRDVIFSLRPGRWTQLWRADADGKQRRLVYAEDGRHVYGGCVSPDGRYVLFTGNKEEDGDPRHAGAPMGLMRLGDAPDGPVLPLPTGWEPHWTAADLKEGARR